MGIYITYALGFSQAHTNLFTRHVLSKAFRRSDRCFKNQIGVDQVHRVLESSQAGSVSNDIRAIEPTFTQNHGFLFRTFRQ